MFTLFGPEGDFKEIVKSQDRRKRQKRRRDEGKWGGNQVVSQVHDGGLYVSVYES